MDRRAFLGALAGGLLAAPLAAEAQQAGKVYRIGSPWHRALQTPPWSRAFVRALRELGLRRRAELRRRAPLRTVSRPSALPDHGRRADRAQASMSSLTWSTAAQSRLPTSVTTHDPDRRVASGRSRAERAASPASRGRAATSPGLDSTAARAGCASRLQLLKEVVPELSRVAVLWNLRDQRRSTDVGQACERDAPLAFDLQIGTCPYGVRATSSAPSSAIISRARARRSSCSAAAMFWAPARTDVADLASKHRLPSDLLRITNFAEARRPHVATGPTSASSTRPARRDYVDKILQGREARATCRSSSRRSSSWSSTSKPLRPSA